MIEAGPRVKAKAKAVMGVALATLLLTACRPAPDFVDTDGHGHRLADYQDKWVIVNYWATWCGPCIKEIPELNLLAEEHADRLVVLGVNFDEPAGEEADKQVRKMKIEFPVFAAEPADMLGIEKPEVLPTTFVFAPGMQLTETLVGPQTQDSILAVTED